MARVFVTSTIFGTQWSKSETTSQLIRSARSATTASLLVLCRHRHRSPLFRLPEEHEVLPGEAVVFADEFEAVGGHLFVDLGLAHFVLGLDGDGFVFGAEFDEDELAVGLEGGAHAGEHLDGVGEFVIDIDEEDHVAGVGGELGVVVAAVDGDDVFEAFAGDVLLEHLDHLRLDIDGIDFAVFADQLGEGEGVVAIPAAHVANGHAGLDVELLAHLGGAFFFIPHAAHEPLGTGPVHGAGDDAALVLRERRGGGGVLLGRQRECGEEEEGEEQAHGGSNERRNLGKCSELHA